MGANDGGDDCDGGGGGLRSIIDDQLASLDDSDCYASVWQEALDAAKETGSPLRWGGRGRGGRGLARRTAQPHDVVVDNVSLEYVSNGDDGAGSKTLLDGTSRLKLLCPHVYAVVGRNGCGKSTLLRRMSSGKMPGFPPRLTTMYIPQEIGSGRDCYFDGEEGDEGDDDDDDDDGVTPVRVAERYYEEHVHRSQRNNQLRIEELERQLDDLDLSNENGDGDGDGDGDEEDGSAVERLCERISALEEENEHLEQNLPEQIGEAFDFFDVPVAYRDRPVSELSGGVRKKVVLACALLCDPDLLLLDEPTNHLDVRGILQLRNLVSNVCSSRRTTVVLVSHDVDLMNDVATDVLHLTPQRTLVSYPGNYRSFVHVKGAKDLHRLRQNSTLERQRTAMIKSIDNMKKHVSGHSNTTRNSRGGRKTRKAIEVKKKKLEKHGIEKNEHGHRRTHQECGGIKEGSINSIDESTRKKNSYTKLLKMAETNVAPVPDKAVQFVFRPVTSTWGEPLITAMDVGHRYGGDDAQVVSTGSPGDHDEEHPTDSDSRMLFDCVDLCVNEGSRTFVLGENGSGKSTFLKILAGSVPPLEGSVHRALNANVEYFHQHVADELVSSALANEHRNRVVAGKDAGGTPRKYATPLSLLRDLFPLKTEQDLRGELTSFGLDPSQATTNIRYLSGGERCRLCLAKMMLQNPQVLILDEPTNHLDVESVDALVYGLRKWNGTVVVVSHDANFVRNVGGDCFVLTDSKLKRVPHGVDYYLKHVALKGLR